jgi:hypothetical protein
MHPRHVNVHALNEEGLVLLDAFRTRKGLEYGTYSLQVVLDEVLDVLRTQLTFLKYVHVRHERIEHTNLPLGVDRF